MTMFSTPKYDSIRSELAGYIEAARVAWQASTPPYTLLVDDDNRESIDLASAAAVFPHLCWEISWKGAPQVGFGLHVSRQFGQLIMAAKVKEGAGTSKCLQLLEFIVPYVERKSGTYCNTRPAEILDPKRERGWYGVPLIVNFWADRISP